MTESGSPRSTTPSTPTNRRIAISAGSLAVVLGALDTYVVVTIMTDIMSDVGIGINQIQRVTPIITGYLLGYIAAMPLLGRRDVLPASRPQIKLLYSTVDEATIASSSSFVTDLPVSVLSSSLAVGPADGAFILVAPSRRGQNAWIEAAVAGLVEAAGERPVIVVNPRLGKSAALGASASAVELTARARRLLNRTARAATAPH